MPTPPSNRIGLLTLGPGAQRQNPYAESFTGHLQRDLLDMESFNWLNHAEVAGDHHRA